MTAASPHWSNMMQNRLAEHQPANATTASARRRSCARRLSLTGAAICVMTALAGGTALAQTGRDVGARCSADSDCSSRVCHPATRLCMISAAAAQPAGEGYDPHPELGREVCNNPSDRCMAKASGGAAGSACSANPDCISGVCHPVTHLCMVSAAAAQQGSASWSLTSTARQGMQR